MPYLLCILMGALKINRSFIRLDDDDETFLHNVYFTINKYMCNWINYQLNNYHCWLL